MIEKAFKFGKDGWMNLGGAPSLVGFNCPHCGNFYAESFQFIMQKDQSAYLTHCHWCNVTLKVVMPSVEFNNQICKEIDDWNAEIEAGCQRKIYARKHGYKYILEIEQGKGEIFCFIDHEEPNAGGGSPCRDIEEAYKEIRSLIARWNKSKVKVTERSLYFYSFTPSITKEQALAMAVTPAEQKFTAYRLKIAAEKGNFTITFIPKNPVNPQYTVQTVVCQVENIPALEAYIKEGRKYDRSWTMADVSFTLEAYRLLKAYHQKGDQP